ncbi:hypothetical protein EV138_0457 [Kribbella voronezhensis]|uniref:Uncharacterized protein n=1 Tax=Kribbella voronezhensis TaxID=2512212 RepID=A0A4R7T528_9ACTN|nr:hypothetical protein EV138_0457 [Kribbella voronezhensis]
MIPGMWALILVTSVLMILMARDIARDLRDR